LRKQRLGLFEGYGIELEYMVVDRDTLDVKPIVDEIIKEEAGAFINEVSRGSIAWSNELALHVIELKTDGPVRELGGLIGKFQHEVNTINERLASHNAMLMPTAMHPWMDPDTEMKLWPHEYNPIYESYNRIFDCRGHGWANLQSVHLNLPFADDQEFERLHAAIRVLLPLLPGLAASSPMADLQLTPFADYRLEVYRNNSRRIPSVTGLIIPEAVFSEADYNEQIFRRMYRDIAPLDPDGILQEEWLNSRGAIARFDRGSIEIRVLDIQECVSADLAVLRLVVDTLKALVSEKWSGLDDQKGWSDKNLYPVLLDVMREGERTILENPDYTALFGVQAEQISVGVIWHSIFNSLYSAEEIEDDPTLCTIQILLELGTLSQRMRNSLSDRIKLDKKRIAEVYRNLCTCLQEGTLFTV